MKPFSSIISMFKSTRDKKRDAKKLVCIQKKLKSDSSNLDFDVMFKMYLNLLDENDHLIMENNILKEELNRRKLK